jgi:ABC-type transport system involved in multi-copper enzyme maturation permease subunit
MRALQRLVSQEFLKLRGMVVVRAVLISLGLGPAAVIGFLRVVTRDIDSVTNPGLLVVGVVVILGGIGSAILAAGVFGQEYDLATARGLLLRGVPRWSFLAAKVVDILAVMTAAGLISVAIGLTCAVAAGWKTSLVEVGSLFVKTGTLVPLSSLVYLAAAALGVVIGRSSAAGMLVGLMLFLTGFVLATLRTRYPLAGWFPETNLFSILGGDFAAALGLESVAVASAVSHLLIVGAVLLALAGTLFDRQDLTG